MRGGRSHRRLREIRLGGFAPSTESEYGELSLDWDITPSWSEWPSFETFETRPARMAAATGDVRQELSPAIYPLT